MSSPHADAHFQEHRLEDYFEVDELRKSTTNPCRRITISQCIEKSLGDIVGRSAHSASSFLMAKDGTNRPSAGGSCAAGILRIYHLPACP